jgi:hypothetical protein
MNTEIKTCKCIDPTMHTDENGIHFCQKCKVEIETFRSFQAIPILNQLVFEFTSFQNWVNKASYWYSQHRDNRHTQFLAIDSEGYVCIIGQNFMDADANNRFPIKVYKLKSSI